MVTNIKNSAGAHTLISVPSISFSGLISKYLKGLNFFEERNLYNIETLRNARNHFIAVMSEGYAKEYIDYCIEHFSLSSSLDIADIQKRFNVVDIEPTKEFLTRSLLASTNNLKEVRKTTATSSPGQLEFWTVTQEEIQLSKLLGPSLLRAKQSCLTCLTASPVRAKYSRKPTFPFLKEMKTYIRSRKCIKLFVN